MPVEKEAAPPLLAMVSSDGKVCVLSRRGNLQEWRQEGETAVCFETGNVRTLTPVASFECIPTARLAKLRKLAERYEHHWARSLETYESNFGPQAQGYGFEFLSAVVAVYDMFGITLEHDDFPCLARFSPHVWLSWRVEDDGGVRVMVKKWTGGYALIKGVVSAAGDKAEGWSERKSIPQLIIGQHCLIFATHSVCLKS
jgi:hypothetical protein